MAETTHIIDEQQADLERVATTAHELVGEMGEEPDQRLEWVLSQNAESFGQTIIDLNASVRGIDREHGFDGDGAVAGSVSSSVPPDQKDKVVIFGELLAKSQDTIRKQVERGEDPQTILTELAVAIPPVLNKMHMFEDGNGRTTRLIYMALRDGDQVDDDKVRAIINKDSERYDTTPMDAVDHAALREMSRVNGTDGIQVVDDFKDTVSYIDEIPDELEMRFPQLGERIIQIYNDGANRDEALRIVNKTSPDMQHLSVTKQFDELNSDPQKYSELIKAYAAVRKQRVEVMMEGLLGERDLFIDNPQAQVEYSINRNARHLGLSEVDSSRIRTAQQFQMAYMETFSPDRK